MSLIIHKKRLLFTAVVGAAIALSAVMIVSLSGDEKPSIETNPPPADEEQPASDTPTDVIPVVPADDSDDDVPAEPEEPVDEPDDTDPDDEKETGLKKAIRMHLKTMERMGEDAPFGLQNSLGELQFNLDKMGEKDMQKGDHDEGQGGSHGQGNAYGHT